MCVDGPVRGYLRNAVRSEPYLMAMVLRAHNEQETVGAAVTALREAGYRVWVAASGCTDLTVQRAERAGAHVLVTPKGLGASTREVLTCFRSEPVVFVDADMPRVRTDVVAVLCAAARNGFVGKGASDRPGRSSVRLPAMAANAGVELPQIPPQALTSAYSSYPAGFADTVELSRVPNGRGSDLMLSLLADAAGIATVVVPSGPREHRNRGADHISVLVDGNRATLAAFARAFPGG